MASPEPKPVVVLTGAAGGLGRALARRFAADGARLVLLDRDGRVLDGFAAELVSSGDIAAEDLLALACDVTLSGACERAIKRTTGAFGRVDCLVNNAGMSHRSPFRDTDPAVLRKVMDVNFFGAVNMTAAALPLLRESGGRIVAISSVAGFAPLYGRTGYAASKHAVNGFFGSLQSELKEEGVGVTIVCPAFIATTLEANALSGSGRPLGPGRRALVGRQMTAEFAADRIVRAVRRGRSRVLLSPTAKLAFWMQAFAPNLYRRGMTARIRPEFARSDSETE